MVPDKSLGKFWPDLEISEAYLMGLVVSSLRVILCLGISRKKTGSHSSKVPNLSFYNPTFTCMCTLLPLRSSSQIFKVES